MAKLVFTNIPAHGHTNPTLAVVKELVGRGHRVLYYSGEEMRSLLEGVGAEFRPYPEPMPTGRELTAALNRMIDATLILIRISEAQTSWFIEEMRRELPALIVYDSTAMWGYLAGRILRIPSLCSVTTFVFDGSQRMLPPREILRFLFQALPQLPRIVRWKRFMFRRFGRRHVGGITEFGRRNLVYTSREFHPENSKLDERFVFVGPSIDPTLRPMPFPWERLGPGALVYISLGTINNADPAFYRTCFEAFGNYPGQFVLSAGKNTDLAALGPVPDNFVVLPQVPQLEILARAAAFITHGGMNSVHEGLYFGVPEIVVPHHLEQLFNGLRVAEVGAGLLLGDRHPYGRVTAAQLRRGLDTILGEPAFRRQAERYGATLKAAGGWRAAADEIVRFAAEPHDLSPSLIAERKKKKEKTI